MGFPTQDAPVNDVSCQDTNKGLSCSECFRREEVLGIRTGYCRFKGTIKNTSIDASGCLLEKDAEYFCVDIMFPEPEGVRLYGYHASEVEECDELPSFKVNPAIED